MIPKLHPNFRKQFVSLPRAVQRRARAAYRRWQRDPNHPGLQFKRLRTRLPVMSVRITDDYRAMGVIDGGEIVWFFIGSHDDYQRAISKL